MSQSRNINPNLNGEYIDLLELMYALLHHIVLIIVVGVVFAAGAFVYTSKFVPKKYAAEATMIVNSGATDYVPYMTNDQINTATKLVDTYSVIIRSGRVMNTVKENLGMQNTFGSLITGVTVKSVEGTQVMKITVTGYDANAALEVCREITKVAPDIIVDTMEASSVKLITEAYTNGNSIYPNVQKNTMMGGMLGMMLVCGIVVLKTILDTKIQTEDDVKKYDVPVVGMIPIYAHEEKRK